MTNKAIAIGSVVTATVVIALGIVAWPGAVKHASVAKVSDKRAGGARAEIAELPNPALSRVRLLVSNLD
jgi:hypothetical protein